jgi:alpha-amylase
MNNADSTWQRNMYTGLPQGTYCDVITGEYDEKTNRCTGQQITVDSNGNADIFAYQRNMAAFHIEQRIPDIPIPTPTTLPASFQRTVIMVHKQTDLGQSLFVRGGLDEASHNCNGDTSAATSNCAVPIVTKTNVSFEDFRSYFNWAQEDDYLDWFGNEPNQGTYDGIIANGTPIVWTTNKQGQFGYNPLNTYGDDYWIADLLMDCSRTDNNWFVLKSFLKPSLVGGGGTWENDISQIAQCRGDAAGPTPSNIGKNHAGLCGAINVFDFGTNDCEIKQF